MIMKMILKKKIILMNYNKIEKILLCKYIKIILINI